MKITVTQQEANALVPMVDVYLKATGVQGRDLANAVLTSIEIIKPPIVELEKEQPCQTNTSANSEKTSKK